MSPLHQLYLTHCTGGTSAIERRTGDGAERKRGLSARASSLLQDDLRRHFPVLSRLVSYALPADAGPEVRAEYTSESAPRRLVFHPQFHGWQVCTRVVFQPSTGKAASPLFAHLVGAELAAAAPPLTALAALQLWQAPGWVEDEPAGLGFDLPCLTDWSELVRPPGRYPPPPRKPVRSRPFVRMPLARDDEIKEETDRVTREAREYDHWIVHIVAATDSRQTELRTELAQWKQQRTVRASQGRGSVEALREQLDHAIVELYREVPLNAGERNVRVPVMLFPE